jgi:hypothetical protein
MTKRKDLLPKWIRWGCWFLLLFLAAPIGIPIGMKSGHFSVGIYGIHYMGPIFHPISIALLAFLTCHGIVAYTLLTGKKRAVDAGLILGGIALTCSIGTNVYHLTRQTLPFDFSFILIILFLNDLLDIRKPWFEADNRTH